MSTEYKFLDKDNAGTVSKVASNDWDLIILAITGQTSGIPEWIFRTLNKVGFADNVFYLETPTDQNKINLRCNIQDTDTNIWFPVLPEADNNIIIDTVENDFLARQRFNIEVSFKEIDTPTPPPSGELLLYADTDGDLKTIDEFGDIIVLGAGGGGGGGGGDAFLANNQTFTGLNKFTGNGGFGIQMKSTSNTAYDEAAIDFHMKNSANVDYYAGSIGIGHSDPTAGSEDGTFDLSLMRGGTPTSALWFENNILYIGSQVRLGLSEGGLTGQRIITFPDATSKLLGDGINNSLGSHYIDISQIAVPANPSSGTRRLFLNSVTGELSLRTSAGTTLSLEAIASGGIPDELLTTTLHFRDIGDNTWDATPVTANQKIELDITPSYTTVASNARRSTLAMNNVNSEADWESLALLANGTDGYDIVVNKAGTGSLRQLNIKMGSFAPLVFRNDNSMLMGSTYLDIPDISVPSNPSLGRRRLFVNSATGELSVRTNAGTTVSLEAAGGGGSGEANTATNVNIGGVGVFKQKTGVNLEFRGINAASSKVTVTLDGTNNEVDLDTPNAAQINLSNIFALSQKFDSYLEIKEIAEPTTPASGYVRYYCDSTIHRLCVKHSDGRVVVLE